MIPPETKDLHNEISRGGAGLAWFVNPSVNLRFQGHPVIFGLCSLKINELQEDTLKSKGLTQEISKQST